MYLSSKRFIIRTTFSVERSMQHRAMPLLQLDRNENLYGPSPECHRALREASLDQLNLYSRSYQKGTKSDLSDRLAELSGIPEHQILLSDGSEDLLKQTVHCYLGAGETLLVPTHSWWYYGALAAEVNGQAATYPLIDHGDIFEYDITAMEQACDRLKPRIVIVASPNNPTGNCIEVQRLTDFALHCRDAVIIVDEAYFGFAEGIPDTAAGLVTEHPRILILRSFSKFYALAGLRIGYAYAGVGLQKLTAFSQRYLGFNRISETIALAALESRGYFRDNARRIESDKEKYYKCLANLPGLSCYHSDANFVLIRFVPGLRQALQQGLKERGIVVKFLNDPGLEDCLRITVGRQDQNAVVIEALEAIVRNSPPTPAL
jgi:histidinol-phosphate aminotransferase